MDTNLFNRIMESEPETLLKSDVASCDEIDRHRLVEKLLALFDQEKLLDKDTYQYYSKLGHPSLADQVRPYICDKKKGFLVRRVAINIAEACGTTGVLPELLAAALDQGDDPSTRVEAACAVARIGDLDAKAQLKPLAYGRGGSDPDDRLKGWALKAVWPDHMTAEELFEALTPPKSSSLFGSYQYFLFDLPESPEKCLKPPDLRTALNWAAKPETEDQSFDDIKEWIINKGWQHLLEVPDLAMSFAKAALTKLAKHPLIASGTKGKPFSETILQDHTRRRTVLLAALTISESIGKCPTLLAYSKTPLVTTDDLPWLIEQFKKTSDDKQPLWIKLIGLVFDPQKPGHLELLLEAKKRCPLIGKDFAWMNPVEIDSPAGRNMKAQYLKHQRVEKRLEQRHKKPLLQPPPTERVLILLDKFEADDPNAWWRLNLEMTLDPNSRYYEFQRELEPGSWLCLFGKMRTSKCELGLSKPPDNM